MYVHTRVFTSNMKRLLMTAHYQGCKQGTNLIECGINNSWHYSVKFETHMNRNSHDEKPLKPLTEVHLFALDLSVSS